MERNVASMNQPKQANYIGTAPPSTIYINNNLPRQSQVQVMEWWRKLTIYLRKIWIHAAAHFGVPKSGLGRLHHEIMRCEYEDVHVLWELLKENEKGFSGDLGSKKKRTFSKLVHWVGRRSPFMRF